MAAVVHNRIAFTEMVEQALSGGDLTCVQKAIDTKRKETITALRATLPQGTTRQRRTLQALFKEQLDVVSDLAATAGDARTTMWKNEFRFYPQPDGTVVCRCNDHETVVGDDFPASEMLVCTPLTRKARRAFFEAMMTGKYFCARGPTGSGKTETAKDTARILGLDAIVVNCSETMTPTSLQSSNALERLDASGPMCPIIFDEFNRLNLEHIEGITAACGDHFVCLTLNPGFAGRTQLPDAIIAKSVVVEMTVLHHQDIVQVMLANEGVLECEALGAQIVACLTSCREKASKQQHYDFGLRFLKAVVTKIGALGRASGYGDEAKLVRDAVGTILFMRSIAADRLVIAAEVKATFGQDVEVPEAWGATSPEAVGAMVAACAQSRHGVCVVGACDRDACVGAVEKAMGAESIVVEGDAAGLHDSEGAFTRAFRAAMAKTAPVNVILNMPLEETSLAQMHTVLDDNKKLCTEKGEVLAMTPYMRIVFFIENCETWSPASVSRLGMVAA